MAQKLYRIIRACMGGQRQQSNVETTGLYNHPSGETLHSASPTSDTRNAIMARWLQSAGLQHLASPLASTRIDHRLLPDLLMQGYGAQSAKERLFKFMRNLNFNGESSFEPYTPTAQTSGVVSSEGFYPPEFRGNFRARLLDLHAMDDTELLFEHIISEPLSHWQQLETGGGHGLGVVQPHSPHPHCRHHRHRRR